MFRYLLKSQNFTLPYPVIYVYSWGVSNVRKVGLGLYSQVQLGLLSFRTCVISRYCAFLVFDVEFIFIYVIVEYQQNFINKNCPIYGNL